VSKNDIFRREMKELARRFGRQVEFSNGGHIMLVRSGQVPVYASCSPRNPRQALMNTERQLKLEARKSRRKSVEVA
jgi:hypothetical protein